MTPRFPDDHYNVPKRGYTIHFFIHSVPFVADVIAGRSSLGGSESACLTTARGLAGRGHDVHIHAVKLDPEMDGQLDDHGVIWHEASGIRDVAEINAIDSLVSLRMPNLFAKALPANHRALWNQDLLLSNSVGSYTGIDEVFYVSEYQRQQYHDMAPDLARIPSRVVMNPIDLARVPPFTPRSVDAPYIAHISRPERGYTALAHIWPRIRKEFPELELRLCRYSSMYDEHGWGRVVANYESAITEIEGVRLAGELNKEQLYSFIGGAELMLYPTSQPDFAETNCIAATEALVCGTPLVADRRGAIPETAPESLPSVTLLDNPDNDAWRTDAYQDALVAAVQRILVDRPDTGPGRDLARGRDGAVAAFAWERNLDDFFDRRYRSKRVAVMRHAFHAENVVHARIIADEITDDGKAKDEVRKMAGFSRKIISQEQCDPEEYGKYSIDPFLEMTSAFGQRLELIGERLLEPFKETSRTLRILDVACGNGSALGIFCRQAQEIGVKLEITAVDFTPEHTGWTKKVLAKERPADWPEPRIIDGDAIKFLEDIQEPKTYDIVFCGEFLEHVEFPEKLINLLSNAAREDGIIGLTCPCGPIGEEMLRWMHKSYSHTHNYSAKHMTGFLNGQRDVRIETYLPNRSPFSGLRNGHWMVTWQPNYNAKPHAIDYRRDIATMRPHQRLNACIIARDAEDFITGCIKTLGCVDVVHVLDTGSRDRTVQLAQSMGAIVHKGTWNDDFAAARNQLLDIVRDQSEWILWIDADERLVNGPDVRGLLDSPLANAYAIKQHHLHIDLDDFHDLPCRIFRSIPEIRFYGAVHEQPAVDETGKGITPAVHLNGIDIAHFGYVTAGKRMVKLQRNHAIMHREIKSDTPRTLSWALWLRDLCQRAEWSDDPAKKRMYYTLVIDTWKKMGWDDPEHDPLHAEAAWPSYQLALGNLGRGVRVRVALAVEGRGKDPEPIKPTTFLAADADDAEAQLRWRTKKVLEAHRPDPPLLVAHKED